jgi:hypothetical protein
MDLRNDIINKLVLNVDPSIKLFDGRASVLRTAWLDYLSDDNNLRLSALHNELAHFRIFNGSNNLHLTTAPYTLADVDVKNSF